MLKKIASVVLYTIVVYTTYSQETNYSSFLLPKELTDNANAVVRNHKTFIEVFDVDDMIIKVDRTVTVLNKLGNRKVGAVVGYDNNSKIIKLTARVYNSLGKEIKKINKNKFIDVSAVDGGTLYSDSRVKYLDYTPTSYPYTIHLEYELKTSSTGFLPNWSPLEGYLVSTQENTYQVKINNGKVRVKEKNFNNYNIENSVNDVNVFYSIKNLKAIKRESESPSLTSIKPKALVTLNNFKTDGVKGYYTNWKEFGLWMNNTLLNGRDIIDNDTKLKVLKLVDTIKNPIEKAKIVYQYVQDKTRYISVQVGIGGIQPIAASEVDNLGYGDCKGLTNYTKALLDLVGVTSYYTHVEANEYEPVSFEEDFASLEQGNHVILNIPNSGNDIWLECTSQTTPFGFLGTFTDDRNVLVVTPEGGVIKRTTSYKNEENLQTIKGEINFKENGNVIANLTRTSKGTQYDSKFSIENFTDDELRKKYKTNDWDYINNLEINKITINNNKNDVVFTENFDVTIKNFASINNNEYLFRVNVFNKESYIPKRYRNRKLPLKINRGYKDIDEYKITIPQGYKLSFLPEDTLLNSKFGNYKISFSKIDDKTFIYKKTILIKEGNYTKEDYKLYRKFRRSIARYENTRIAILKN